MWSGFRANQKVRKFNVKPLQGPVAQSPIKLILEWRKILIVIYLLLKDDFSQD